MTTQEIIVNAIVFVCGWVLKRPALVESVVAKLFAKKEEAVKPEPPKKEEAVKPEPSKKKK